MININYKSESDYDDALVLAARNTCDNCGEVVADLHRVHESATPFYACDDCCAEIEALLEREDAGTPNPADRMVLAAMRKPAAVAKVAA